MRRTARPWPIAFTVEGLNIERFVRRAGEQGVRLTGMKRPAARKLHALVREDQLPALRELALQGGWKLTAGSRKGAGHAADWLKGRWLLVCAVLIGGIALFAATRIVWQIQVTDAGSYEADIRSALTEWGVSAPMLRRQVDIGQLRDDLEWRYPRIAWFECGWRGSALVIRPVEGNLPRTDTDAEGPCDVTAVRDGVVHTVVTRAGTPVVQPGDLVRAGDVLIKGEERTAEGHVRPVSARGSVTARVWKGAAVTIPSEEIETHYTGRTETAWTLRTPWFDLWPMGECAFSQYDTAVTETRLSSFLIPMTLRFEQRMEAEYTRIPRDPKEMEQSGRDAAVRKLRENLSPEESLIDIWGNCSMIEDGNLWSVAIGEMLVEIGQQVPSTGMAAPEEIEPR